MKVGGYRDSGVIPSGIASLYLKRGTTGKTAGDSRNKYGSVPRSQRGQVLVLPKHRRERENRECRYCFGNNKLDGASNEGKDST